MFRDYLSIIAKSVAETGYDYFRPLACLPGSVREELLVLDGDLSDEGEESVALSWAESLAKNSDTIFLAFRGGKRRITVLELKDGAIIDGQVIQVNPYAEAS